MIKKYKMKPWIKKNFGDKWKLIAPSRCGPKPSKHLEKIVKDFYVRDDVSRITAGKKETVTKSKVKEQKRFLLDSMKNLHSKFKAEHNLEHIRKNMFTQALSRSRGQSRETTQSATRPGPPDTRTGESRGHKQQHQGR